MKFKREGQAVGHGLGKIQARTIGKRRRVKGVSARREGHVRHLGTGRSVRRRIRRLLRAQDAA